MTWHAAGTYRIMLAMVVVEAMLGHRDSPPKQLA